MSGLGAIRDSNTKVSVLFLEWNFVHRATRASQAKTVSLLLMYKVSPEPRFDEGATVAQQKGRLT